MLKYYAQELSSRVLTDVQKSWFQQIEHILPWCHGFGLDIGSGDRTLHPNIVRVDYLKLFKPDVVADGCHLPFKNDAFDFVMSNQSVEHMADTRMALLEWLRVSKGPICIVGPDIRAHGPAGAPGSNPEHKYMFTGEEFFALVGSLPDVEIIESYSEISLWADFVCVFRRSL